MHYLFHSTRQNPPYGDLRPKRHRAGKCNYCGQDIPENQGVLFKDLGAKSYKDTWQLYHLACLNTAIPELAAKIQADVATQRIVTIDLDDPPTKGVMHADSTGAAGNDFFQVLLPAFRSAGGKGVNVGGRWKNVIAFNDIPKLVKALETTGRYTVSISDKVAEHTKSVAKALETQSATIKERLKKIEEGIKSKGKMLLPHQIQGIEWLATRPGKSPNTCGGALLADDPGLGKTMQSILALPEGAPCLVVCPVSVKYNWQDEFMMWRPERGEPVVIEGADGFRWPARNETVIIGYPTLPKQLVIPKARGTVVLVDEAQYIKGKSQRNERLKKISEQVYKTDGCVWLLTGTPLENIADNVYRVLESAELVEPAYGSRTGFIRAWGVPLQHTSVGTFYDWRAAEPNTKEVTAGLDKVMLRRQQGILRAAGILPKKVRQQIPVELDAKALALLDAIEISKSALDEATKDLDQEEIGFLKDADKEEDLTIGEISRARKLLAKAKIPAAEAIVNDFEQRKEPLLVFSAYREPVVYFGDRHGWARIDGSVKAKDRRDIVKKFQEGKLKGVAIVIAAGGTGLTLHRANTALFVDLEWNPAKNIQAEDRIYRIGQKRDVTILQLIGNHQIDIHLNQLLLWKQDQIDRTINAVTGTPVPVQGPQIIEAIAPVVQTKPFDKTGFAEGPKDVAKAREEFLNRLEELRKDKLKGKLEPTRQQVDDPTRRPPANEQEAWLLEQAVMLSRLDDDFAKEQNGIGWNKPDTIYGHQLATLGSHYGGLTNYQWQDLADMVPKYHRQFTSTRPGSQTAKVRRKSKESGRIVAAPTPSQTTSPSNVVASSQHEFKNTRGKPPKDPSMRKCAICGRTAGEHN